MSSIIASVRVDIKKIATDVITVAVAVSGVLAVLVNVAPSIHLPATAITWLVTLSTIVAAVITEAQRVVQAKSAAKKAAEEALRSATVTAKRTTARRAGK